MWRTRPSYNMLTCTLKVCKRRMASYAAVRGFWAMTLRTFGVKVCAPETTQTTLLLRISTQCFELFERRSDSSVAALQGHSRIPGLGTGGLSGKWPHPEHQKKTLGTTRAIVVNNILAESRNPTESRELPKIKGPLI